MSTSIPLQPTLTTAGIAAVFNDQNTGVEFALTHIAFGTAQYVPDGSETALRVEKVRVPIAGGGRISPTQIQIYGVAMALAGNPFFVGEVGFFGNNGATLLAVYSSTGTPSLYLSDTVATSVSYALGLAALPANSVTVTIDPSASAALLIMGNHVANPDPHPQYVQKVNGVAFYDPTVTFNNGAQIIGDDLLCYQSVQANNIGNTPSSSPTWWVPLYNYGDTPVTGLTNANVTLSSTQAARAHITFSGALTAPLNIVFPNWVKDWTVVNNTTGAFALTCKTAAGTGVAIPQNGSPTKIRGDGTNIAQQPENVAFATAGQHAAQVSQIQAGTFNVVTDTGGANAYVTTFSPALSAPVPGAPFWMKVKTANTGASTLNATGTVYPLVGGAHAALQGGEMFANGWALIDWNATLASYVLLVCTGGALQVAPGQASGQATNWDQIGYLRAVNSIVGNTTLTGAQAAGTIVIAPSGNVGGFTVTLTPTAGKTGYQFIVYNTTTGTLTLTGTNFNTAFGSAVSTIVMPPGTSLVLEWDGVSHNGVGGSGAIGSLQTPHAANGTNGDFVQISAASTYSLPAGGTWVYSIQQFNGSPATSIGSISGIAAGGTLLFNSSGNAAQGFAWRIR